MAAKKSVTKTERLALHFDPKGTEKIKALAKRLGHPDVHSLLRSLCARAEWMQDSIDAGGKVVVEATDDRYIFNKRNPLFKPQ